MTDCDGKITLIQGTDAYAAALAIEKGMIKTNVDCGGDFAKAAAPESLELAGLTNEQRAALGKEIAATGITDYASELKKIDLDQRMMGEQMGVKANFTPDELQTIKQAQNFVHNNPGALDGVDNSGGYKDIHYMASHMDDVGKLVGPPDVQPDVSLAMTGPAL